ncbi:MAG TPA: hypothetical protein VFT30_08965, partial [Nitrospira sp.]|nr:hypothetical protein [Nitrospira sp.]
DGKEQSFPIRSQIRSKVAAIPIGVKALFLLDETNQVADVAFKNPENMRKGNRHEPALTPAKNPHERVSGTIVESSEDHHSQITVRMDSGSDRTYEVRETSQKKLANLKKGDQVVLLIDSEKKVIDVAIPPK